MNILGRVDGCGLSGEPEPAVHCNVNKLEEIWKGRWKEKVRREKRGDALECDRTAKVIVNILGKVDGCRLSGAREISL